MNIIELAPEFLKDYEKNARVHPEAQIKEIMNSIESFGFNVPVEVNDDLMILSGHARVEAAKRLKLLSIPVVIHKHLTDELKQRGYVLAANKIQMNSEWDNNILAGEIIDLDKAGFDLSLTGFSKNEIDEICHSADFDPGSFEDQGKLDILEPKKAECPECGHFFDI